MEEIFVFFLLYSFVRIEAVFLLKLLQSASVLAGWYEGCSTVVRSRTTRSTEILSKEQVWHWKMWGADGVRDPQPQRRRSVQCAAAVILESQSTMPGRVGLIAWASDPHAELDAETTWVCSAICPSSVVWPRRSVPVNPIWTAVSEGALI